MSSETHRNPPSFERDPESAFLGEVPPRFATAASDVDPDLIARTKNQIRSLVQEIADLADSTCELEHFWEGFLTRVTSALGGIGGGVWLQNADGNLELIYQINLSQTVLAHDAQAQAEHSRMIQRLLEAGQPALVPPHSGSSDGQDGNPTEHLLVIGPLRLDQQAVGLVEIFQRTGAGPATQRGYQRFLVQMCDLANNYLRNRRLRQYAQQQELWQKLEQFIRAVHQGLDTRQTSFAIANEGRRLIDCDRLGLALRRGSSCQIQAVSGLDALERRAEQIKDLNRLAAAVIRGRKPLWYSSATTDLPPQIETHLHRYIDRAHTKMLAIVPLVRPAPEGASAQRQASAEIIGALIVEQLAQPEPTPLLRQRVDVVATHAQDALVNSFDHNRIFLLPLWKALGRWTDLLRGTRRPRTLIALGIMAGLIALLCWFPAPFTLGANGQLQPQNRFEIFAHIDGTLEEILVPQDPLAVVEQGEVLARMTNNDLQVAIRDLEGQLKQHQERIRNLERALSDKLDRLDQLQVERELAESIELERSVASQLQVKNREREMLQVVAPVRGTVVNWQLRESLLRRPVQKGQNLMSIVDPNTPWELELALPEKRFAHLMAAARESREPLAVTFTLASHPGQEFSGTLRQWDQRLEVRGPEGNTARILVEFDESQFPPDLLRMGTRVHAQIHCGTRPVGYVWFRELFETIHSAWLMWF